MSEGQAGGEGADGPPDGPEARGRDVDPENPYPEVPDWDDEYLDRVSDRLLFNYDLERDRRIHGETFDLYGEMRIESQKQFLHPSINYANHDTMEYLLARRQDSVRVADLERLVDLGHDLADDWVEADEEHYGTDFTFALVVPDIPAPVREFVDGFRDRTLLKFGYYGHYEVNLIVVAPESETVVASQEADAAEAFALWADVLESESGLLSRLASLFGR